MTNDQGKIISLDEERAKRRRRKNRELMRQGVFEPKSTADLGLTGNQLHAQLLLYTSMSHHPAGKGR